ncbi:MAG: hypothetical protein IT289_06515 [Oligoflexia bacterium]|nr:hypothetical protein [Oligoflexia bacterium]
MQKLMKFGLIFLGSIGISPLAHGEIVATYCGATEAESSKTPYVTDVCLAYEESMPDSRFLLVKVQRRTRVEELTYRLQTLDVQAPKFFAKTFVERVMITKNLKSGYGSITYTKSVFSGIPEKMEGQTPDELEFNVPQLVPLAHVSYHGGR